MKIQIARQAVQPLLDCNYVEQVTEYSTWLNPIMLVTKQNGKMRFCLDLRGHNNLVEQDNYLIPSIVDLTDNIRDMKVFPKIDIAGELKYNFIVLGANVY